MVSFTAAAILRLQDKGELNINDKISKYIDIDYWYKGKVPDFAHITTIHHLLTHTSGIPELFDKVAINSKTTQKDVVKEILKFSSESVIPENIGKKFKYSNSNFVLLGLIIEQVSKKALKDFLWDEFFIPLEMKSTYLLTLEDVLQKNYNIKDYPIRYYIQPNVVAAILNSY